MQQSITSRAKFVCQVHVSGLMPVPSAVVGSGNTLPALHCMYYMLSGLCLGTHGCVCMCAECHQRYSWH